jgi:hypothetical protein
VWVCEPQSVATEAMCRGRSGLRTSKTRMPSQPGAFTASAESHAGLVCGRSIDMNSRWPHTDTSLWVPWHSVSLSSFGRLGLPMSRICRRL